MSDSSKAPSSAASSASKRVKSAPTSTRPLLPLAPKPLAPPPATQLAIRTATPQSSGTAILRRRSPAPCAVCYRVGCQLPTHTAFTNVSRSSSRNSSERPATIAPPSDAAYTSSYAYKLAQQYVDTDIAASRVDPFYDLPLDAETNTPEMHRLFHSWFVIETRDCFRIPRPREISSDIIFSPFFLPAMQDPLLCLSVLAASAACLPRAKGQPSRNITSLTLLGQAIQQMRERIHTGPGHISDTTITAAVFLWIVNIFLEDTEAMASHSRSIYAFVETRGGLHKLGLLGAVARVIRWIDTTHSFILPVSCHYLDPPDPEPPMNAPPLQYGTYWDQKNLAANILIDDAVVTVCQDTCRLLEQLEQAEKNGMSGAEYLHMIERLCALYTRGSLVRAKSYDDNRVNECVSVAVALVQFQCFSGFDKLIVVARTNVGRLVAAIKATGGPSFWQKDLDLLTWLLFVAVMVPVTVEDKSWCLPLLCRAITTQFGHHGKLKDSWRQTLNNCLRRFVWCDLRLKQYFTATCLAIGQELDYEELEAGMSDGAD